VRKSVIIVAGGSGQRMLSETPKQFLPVAGKPALIYSLEAFREAIPEIEIILVLPEKHIATWQKILDDHNVSISHVIVNGGETRFQSVKNGLQKISSSGLTAIHDGARPLITSSLIRNLFDKAERYGSAIPVIPVSDTVRKIENNISIVVNRDDLRLVQTPQIFKSEVLLQVYKNYSTADFTDDAAAIEAAGHKIYLCEGDPENIKLTKPADLLFAESIIRLRKSI
jgi:2-C-methyl-D-erythritol 4-phosphate cytidylyltransferase